MGNELSTENREQMQIRKVECNKKMGNELSTENIEQMQEDGEGNCDGFTKHYNKLREMLQQARAEMEWANKKIGEIESDEEQCDDDMDDQEAEITALLGRFPSREKAKLYLDLSEQFPEADELDKEEAVAQCGSVEQAASFLNRDCLLCADTFPETRMTTMWSCQHTCCDNCAANYYIVQIKEKSIREAKCPFCEEPSDENGLHEHFLWLGEKLKALHEKGLIEEAIVKLFDRKVTQNLLESDPRFRWCGQCPNGMIIENECQKWMECDNCKKKSCVDCGQLWMDQHEKLTCERFLQWKHDNDPEYQALGVEEQLQKEGIQCPHCKRRYFLARGGCLHFTCSHCKHEFCAGCGSSFHRGSACPEGGAACRSNGLHAHHPNNCFYYLRDRPITEIEQILRNNKVQFQDVRAEEDGRGGCKVLEQKDSPEGLVDEECGKQKYKQTGLCATHYAEQLCLLLNRHRIKV